MFVQRLSVFWGGELHHVADQIVFLIRQYYLQETEEDLPGEEQLTFCRLVDEFSGADIILSFPIECIKARAGLSEYPQLDAYLKKLQNRPAYKRALEKGGAYNIMA